MAQLPFDSDLLQQLIMAAQASNEKNVSPAGQPVVDPGIAPREGEGGLASIFGAHRDSSKQTTDQLKEQILGSVGEEPKSIGAVGKALMAVGASLQALGGRDGGDAFPDFQPHIRQRPRFS